MTNAFSKSSTVSKYKSGKIYRIDGNGKTYIGSTIMDLEARIYLHKTHFKSAMRGTYRYCSSFEILNECDDYSISLVETYPCDSKSQLWAREAMYIQEIECVNRQSTGKFQMKPTPLKVYIDSINSEYRKRANALDASKRALARKMGTSKDTRDYMREYMRRYRAVKSAAESE